MQTLIIADDQILLAKSEDDLQRPGHKLQTILTKYNVNISETKTKAMAMNGKIIPRVKIVINNKLIEQVTEFICLSSHLSQYINQKDIDRNFIKYNRLNGTLKRNFGKKN